MLMFLFFLCNIYPKSRIYSVSHALTVSRVTKEARRDHNRYSCPKLAKEIFCTIEHHTQFINWDNYPEGGSIGL